MAESSILVIEIPPPDSQERGTITMGFGEESRTFDLTPDEEMCLALLVAGKVRGSCGPSFFR